MKFKFKDRSLFFKQKHPIRFFSSMFHANQSNLHKIYQHHFNRELFNGSLCPIIFGRYLRDDYYYLCRFSKILLQLSPKTAPINYDLSQLLEFMAKDIINNELSMQQQYKNHLQDLKDFQPSQTISSYIQFLSETTILSEASIGLSAILPCFWIYYELGKIHSESPSFYNNPYKSWIETYSNTDFINATQQLSTTITSLEQQASPQVMMRMEKAFTCAVQFELDFFDEMYQPEKNLGSRISS